MNTLTIFDYHDQPVRTVQIDGEPWFVGKDICRCLGITNHSDALSRLHKDERRDGVGTTDPVRDDRLAIAINEPGVYRLIFESRKPEAEKFKRWVFHEVLPALRKTGRYAVAGIDWEAARDKLALVKEARLTHGRAAARQMWLRLGLPDISGSDALTPPAGGGLADYVADFLDEMTEPDGRAQVSARAMHDAYREWAATSRAPLIMAPTLGKCLAQLGVGRRKSNGYPVYLGRRLRPVA